MKKIKIILSSILFIGMLIILPKSVKAAVSTDSNGNFYANGTAITIADNSTNIGSRTVLTGFDTTYFSSSSTTFSNGSVIYWGTPTNGGYVYASSNIGVFGGCSSTTFTGDTSVTMTGGEIGSLFGGGRAGSITGNTNVVFSGGKVQYVFGGSAESSVVSGTAHVTISNSSTSDSVRYDVYGGGGSNTTTGNTLVEIRGKVISNVFGGGASNSSKILGNTRLIIDDGAYIELDVYGGGVGVSTVGGNSAIELKGGIIFSSVYGGSQYGPSYVSGTRTVSVSSDPLVGMVYFSIGWNFIHGIRLDTFTDNKVLVTGPLTGVEGGIKLMPKNQQLGTVVATAETESYLDASYFRMYSGEAVHSQTENPIWSNYLLNKETTIDGAELKISMIYGEANYEMYDSNGGAFFGNGMALIITGTGDTTTIYKDLDRDGNLDSVEAVTENILFSGTSHTTVFGGGNSENSNYDTMITMLSGTISALYGGGYNNNITGNTNIIIKGGTVLYSVNGGGASYTTIPAVISGNSNITIFGGTVNSIYGNSRNGGSVAGNNNITRFGDTLTDYTITYQTNNGTTISPSHYNVADESFTLPPAINRVGYIFKGWKVTTGAEGGTGLVLNTTFSENQTSAKLNCSYGNVVLTARWIPIDYAVTFHTNGGTAISTDHYNITIDSLILPSSITKTGYIFEGWYEDEECTILFGTGGESYIPTANMNLYAKWRLNPNVINPQTFDNSNILLWTILMIISICGIVSIIFIQKKQKIHLMI